MFQFHVIALGSGGVAACVRCERTPDVAYPAGQVLARIAALPAEVGSVAGSAGATGTQQGAAEHGAGSAVADVAQKAGVTSDPAAGVALGGFEPFSHPALPELIAAVVERGVRRLLLQTDGGALIFGDNARGVVDAGVRIFEFGYRAGNEVLHDELCGRPGLAAERAQGIHQLRELEAVNPDLHLTLIGVARLCRHNTGELYGIAEAALREGLDGLRIEIEPGAQVDAVQLRAARELLLPAGVLLFGDGCEQLLGGARPYELLDDQVM